MTNSTVDGAGSMMTDGAKYITDNWISWLCGVLNGALSFLGVQFQLSEGQLSLIMLVAGILLFWLRAKTVLEFIKTYGWAILGVLIAYVLLGPILHII